jgi:pyridoxine/pyridoxamine 5'-phosphate oxidase
VDDLDAHARELIDANSYVSLGTADADGKPWVSPVFFATADYRLFFWMSAGDAVHSLNIARRPQVSMVIFDSQVAPYHGRAVYLSGTATEVAEGDLVRSLEIYPRPSHRESITVELGDVTAPSTYRLYQATVSTASVLCPRAPRQPCHLHGLSGDHRTPVTPWRHAP